MGDRIVNNRNKPFDQFTIEQLAGDLLLNATLDQKVASGFNRNHMINFEGGAVPDEYHTAYIIDRVNTTGAVWLGLTVGCAQCHDPQSRPDHAASDFFRHQLQRSSTMAHSGKWTPTARKGTPFRC